MSPSSIEAGSSGLTRSRPKAFAPRMDSATTVFWAAPGSYQVSISGGGIAASTRTVSVAGTGGGVPLTFKLPSGAGVSLQLVAPIGADLVTIYRGTACRLCQMNGYCTMILNGGTCDVFGHGV
jgi:hypothetical protein